ncbi:hypothetical protein L0F63_006451, partial [Massospora cicadina]
MFRPVLRPTYLRLWSILPHAGLTLIFNSVRNGVAWDAPCWSVIERSPLFAEPSLLSCLPGGRDLPRWDHVFAQHTVDCSFYIEQAPIITDHPALYITGSAAQADLVPPTFGLKRYHMRSLESPRANATLRGLFHEVVPLLQHLISDAYNALVDTDAPIKAALIDRVDEFLLSMIAACCSLLLGTYDANQVKLSPDSFLCYLDNCTSVTASVQLYKRAAKVVTATHLQSHSADLSPVEDVIVYFSEVFSQPNPQLSGIDPGMAANYGSPADEFLHYFSLEKVLKQMRDYPQSMSCGEDSIHIKILLVLLPYGISGILSQFFQLCLWCGITPH